MTIMLKDSSCPGICRKCPNSKCKQLWCFAVITWFCS